MFFCYILWNTENTLMLASYVFYYEACVNFDYLLLCLNRFLLLKDTYLLVRIIYPYFKKL